jgi:hypothetical protein
MNQTSRNESIDLFQPDQATRLIIDILTQIDHLVTFTSLIVHIFYFYLIYKLEQLRKLTLLYLHHSVFIGFMFNLHYLIYFNYTSPFFQDDQLNRIMCTVSEFLWSFLKTQRAYSIALIALYRLIAVYKLSLYKYLNKHLVWPLIFLYLLVIMFVLALKFAFKTTYGSLYCFDGYSKSYFNRLLYFIIKALIGLILPTLFTLFAYFFIRKKLKQSKERLSSNYLIKMEEQQIEIESDVLTNRKKSSIFNKSESKMANQFLIMNICEIVSCLMLIGLGMRYLFENFNEYYNVPRKMLRIINLIAQLLIPLFCIHFSNIIRRNDS